MKKSLIAAAVLGSFAAASYAAPTVQMFGFVDTGIGYQHISVTGEKSESTFGMETGINETSRWGLTGEERIGGATISFTLESEFNSDSGTLADDRFFDREAQITISSDYGALTLGRIGALSAATGTYDVVYSVGDSFDGGDWDVFGLAAAPIVDNAITYQSPEFAGLKLTLQYSFQNDSVNGGGSEGHSTTDRYLGAAINYEVGNFQAVLSYENIDRGSADSGETVTKDGHLINFGVNYNFEDVAQVFVMGQYFKGWDEVGGASLADKADKADELGLSFTSGGLKGWGAHVGAIFPVAGGDLTLGLYYVDAELDGGKLDGSDFDIDVKYYGAAVRYLYPLSKRTSLYAGASYGVSKFDNFKVAGYDIGGEEKTKTTSVYCGLTHAF